MNTVYESVTTVSWPQSCRQHMVSQDTSPPECNHQHCL